MTTGRTNLETNSVFQSFILMHMPQTAAPLEEKNKSASSAEDGRGRGGRKGHGALKETRRKTHKRAKRTLSAFPTLFLIKENTTKRKQSLGSLQRDL